MEPTRPRDYKSATTEFCVCLTFPSQFPHHQAPFWFVDATMRELATKDNWDCEGWPANACFATYTAFPVPPWAGAELFIALRSRRCARCHYRSLCVLLPSLPLSSLVW